MQASTSTNTPVVKSGRAARTSSASFSREDGSSTPSDHRIILHPSRSASETSIPDLETESLVKEVPFERGKCPSLPEHPPLDDLDLMICHEEFPSLVALVAKVKAIKNLQDSCASAVEYYRQHRQEIATSALSPAEVLSAVEQMQEQLSFKNVVIRRGSYPLTDSMMDDNFSILQRELEFCQSCIGAVSRTKGTSSNGNGEAIAVKYAKWQTDILMNWIIENKADPFPKTRDTAKLTTLTGLTHAQVVNWTTNVRKRNRKATLNGKKPHHFIDFVFMAQEREEQKARSQNGQVASPTESTATTTPSRKKIETGSYPSPIPSTPISSSGQHHYARPRYPYAHSPSAYAAHTPPPPGQTSHYHGHYNMYSSPPPRHHGYPYHHWHHCPPKDGPSPKGGQRNMNLNSVTESFEDPTIEPLSFAFDEVVHETVLKDFASCWGDTPTRAKQMTSPTVEEAQTLLSMTGACLSFDNGEKEPSTLAIKQESPDQHVVDRAPANREQNKAVIKQELQDEDMEDIEPATLDPPDLKREASFLMEWDDLDMDSMVEAAVWEGVEL